MSCRLTSNIDMWLRLLFGGPFRECLYSEIPIVWGGLVLVSSSAKKPLPGERDASIPKILPATGGVAGCLGL